MKRKYREAMRAQAVHHWDGYVDGITEDDAALDALQWHDEYVPEYEPSADDHHQDHNLPF